MQRPDRFKFQTVFGAQQRANAREGFDLIRPAAIRATLAAATAEKYRNIDYLPGFPPLDREADKLSLKLGLKGNQKIPKNDYDEAIATLRSKMEHSLNNQHTTLESCIARKDTDTIWHVWCNVLWMAPNE